MKKHIYYASFISGLQKPISELLHSTIKDCVIRYMMDGAVVFETDFSYDKLRCHCFNNIFRVIDIFPTKNSEQAIDTHINKLVSQGIQADIISVNSKNYRTFRIVTSCENKLVSVNLKGKINIEKLIAKQSKLHLERSKGDAEFWFLYRSEGYCFFMKRMSKHSSYDKLLNKGELHPELAYMMNYISVPNKTDICLDPFCGYGSIPEQRLLHFPTGEFYAFDINESVTKVAKGKIKNTLSTKYFVKNVNVKDIQNHFKANSIDRIITDPPWGIFEEIKEGVQNFYDTFIKQFSQIIKPTGSIVILTAKKDELQLAVEKQENLSIVETYNILVSGKKSAIFYIVRKNKVIPPV